MMAQNSKKRTIHEFFSKVSKHSKPKPNSFENCESDVENSSKVSYFIISRS